MSAFPIHTPASAPSAAQALLAQAQERYGFVPHLFAGMASAPALLAAYVDTSEAYASSSLSAIEQQVVSLTASRLHECHYCVAAHSTIARMQRLDPAVVQALRQGVPLPDTKLEALRQFTQQMVEQRGWARPGQLESLLAAGYSQQSALEVVLGIAMKVMSNYSNHLVGTPLDAAFQSEAIEA
ncbi:carboxymuconolactone decarboxylase family protein [Roseateles sp. DB2]|uniref:carboxymuconolactone decarboxylase family protein n=1 Tax=Roseateles sp. DB2 TaxID=3453717 RepID=UPI003EED7654